MKLCFIFGTRPEILKFNSVINEAKLRGHEAILVHTGQHYDYEMSEVFFKELELPNPDVYLDVGSGDNTYQIGKTIIDLENVLNEQNPDAVLVVGDTNAGAAGAIAAVLKGIPVIHVEAGARSFDMTMPEEINRRMIDSISRIRFCPTEEAFNNLRRENEEGDTYLSGDTLVETATLAKLERTDEEYSSEDYILLTLHRADNTDDPARLEKILSGLAASGKKILFPIHPRTKKMIESLSFGKYLDRFDMLQPLPYARFLSLIRGASIVITDSGGVQQEAGIFKKYCLTLRNNTEWVNTISSGGNTLVDVDVDDLKEVIAQVESRSNIELPAVFPLGASKRILQEIEKYHLDGTLKYQKSYQVT